MLLTMSYTYFICNSKEIKVSLFSQSKYASPSLKICYILYVSYNPQSFSSYYIVQSMIKEIFQKIMALRKI